MRQAKSELNLVARWSPEVMRYVEGELGKPLKSYDAISPRFVQDSEATRWIGHCCCWCKTMAKTCCLQHMPYMHTNLPLRLDTYLVHIVLQVFSVLM